MAIPALLLITNSAGLQMVISACVGDESLIRSADWKEKWKLGGSNNSYKTIYYTSIACCLFALESLIKGAREANGAMLEIAAKPASSHG